MKKAILIHLAAFAVYVLMVLFILGGEKTDTSDRFIIVWFLITSQLIVVMINYISGLYDK